MDSKKMVSLDLRNLSIMIKRYIEKERKFENCMAHHGHDHRHHGATHMHMMVMDYLLDNKDKDIYQKDFEKEFSIRRSTATNMLKRMEHHGLIKRVSVPEDARLKKIVLTSKAMDFTESMDKSSKKLEEKLTKNFSEKDRNTLSSLLKKMIKNMEEEN